MKTSLSIQYAQMQLGIVSLRKHQIKPIQSILDHRDTLVIAPTSSGKSAIYQIAAPSQEREEITQSLGMTKPCLFTMSLRRDNIILLKEDCTGCDIKYRLKRLKHYIRKYGSTGQVVVYCSSKKYADLVFNYLDDRFPDKIAKCHAYMDPNRRQRNELDFIHGCKRIMVATTAFGMGVDAAAMRLVVHFQLPLSVVDYYQ